VPTATARPSAPCWPSRAPRPRPRPEDIDLGIAAGARLFYLGYPPLLQRTYQDGGAALVELLAELRRRGVTTVLDTTLPDPEAASGRVDWAAWLARVLPQVDLFVPSLAEALFMLDRSRYDAGDWRDASQPAPFVRDLGDRLIALGVAVAGVKLGEGGLTLRSAGAERLAGTLLADDPRWVGRELWTPVFEVEVAGTVGAGDAAVAGLMAALLRGSAPVDALTMAAAVAASSVEAADSSGGVRTWEATQQRLDEGWPRRVVAPPSGWSLLPSGVWECAAGSA
jgi:sugar/nucleoside kinase (ribokinase family)